VSDTPRMRAAQMAAMEHMTGDVYCVGCDLEIELNEANERIQQLEEELIEAKNKHAALVADVALYEDRGERIKRLEEAGDEMHRYIFDQTNTRWIICAIQWREAKEAKP